MGRAALAAGVPPRSGDFGGFGGTASLPDHRLGSTMARMIAPIARIQGSGEAEAAAFLDAAIGGFLCAAFAIVLPRRVLWGCET